MKSFLVIFVLIFLNISLAENTSSFYSATFSGKEYKNSLLRKIFFFAIPTSFTPKLTIDSAAKLLKLNFPNIANDQGNAREIRAQIQLVRSSPYSDLIEMNDDLSEIRINLNHPEKYSINFREYYNSTFRNYVFNFSLIGSKAVFQLTFDFVKPYNDKIIEEIVSDIKNNTSSSSSVPNIAKLDRTPMIKALIKTNNKYKIYC